MNQSLRKIDQEPLQSFESELNGTKILYDFRGVLFLPESKTLVMSDLHLEKGAAFARRGLLHPPYDTIATLNKLAECIEHYLPETVVSLGDSFHDKHGSAFLSDDQREKLCSLQANCKWIWISGNHDPAPPLGLAGDFIEEIEIETLTFQHEPTKDSVLGEVSGHLHPAAKITRRGKTVRKPCFACDGQKLIMPAFGTTTGCLALDHPAFKEMFDRKELCAFVLGQSQIYPVSYSRLKR